jgi:hypothetical protein
MLYLISYDLTQKPETEYDDLWATLKEWGAHRILYSEWLLESTASAVEVRDALLTVLRHDDYLWVVEVTTNSAWHKVRDGDMAKSKAMFSSAVVHALT